MKYCVGCRGGFGQCGRTTGCLDDRHQAENTSNLAIGNRGIVTWPLARIHRGCRSLPGRSFACRQPVPASGGTPESGIQFQTWAHGEQKLQPEALNSRQEYLSVKNQSVSMKRLFESFGRPARSASDNDMSLQDRPHLNGPPRCLSCRFLLHARMHRSPFLLFALACCLIGFSESRAENWPQWRGPRGTGVSSERGVPLFWSEQRGIAWKVTLPAWGDSTPVCWGDAVFVTGHSDDGRLVLLRIDARTGRLVWKRQVGTGTAPRKGVKRKQIYFHKLHNLASPSPVTDGTTVVAHFGNGDLAAYDFDGNRRWHRNLQADYGPYTVWYGHANSPVLFDGTVISVCMQDSLADLQDDPVESYVVAHDLATGKTRWKTSRMPDAKAEQCDAYTTPVLARVDGHSELIVMGGNQLDGYDPRTGAQLWYLPGLIGGRTVTSPTVARNLVFSTRGLRGDLFSVRLGQRGKLSRRDIVWIYGQGTPDTCSLVAWDTLLFAISDEGIARCFDTRTGKLKWKHRLPGKYKASPVAVDGNVLFLNLDGLCTVVSAASYFNKLAENQLDDRTLASPMISNRHVYVRGRKHLYCIGHR